MILRLRYNTPCHGIAGAVSWHGEALYPATPPHFSYLIFYQNVKNNSTEKRVLRMSGKTGKRETGI